MLLRVARFVVHALGLESRHTDADRLLNWRVRGSLGAGLKRVRVRFTVREYPRVPRRAPHYRFLVARESLSTVSAPVGSPPEAS